MRTYIPGAAGAADLKFFREDGGVLSCNTVTERVSEVSGMASFHENDKILQQQHRSNTIIHNNIHNNIYQVTFFTLIICLPTKRAGALFIQNAKVYSIHSS